MNELVSQLVDALMWSLDKDPSPCRCIDDSTPPHICKGCKAIAAGLQYLEESVEKFKENNQHNERL